MTNDSEVAVFLDRIEFMSGRRREAAALSKVRTEPVAETDGGIVLGADGADSRRMLARHGLLMPGATITFTRPYQVLEKEERVLLTVERLTEQNRARTYLPDPGNGSRWLPATDTRLEHYGDPAEDRRAVITLLGPPRKVGEEGTYAAIPCPKAPFDPHIREFDLQAWTWSQALTGFVFRLAAAEYRLQLKDEVVPLPSLPFPLLYDMDRTGEVEVRVRTRVETIRPADLRDFLIAVRDRRHRIVFTEAGADTPYATEPAE